MMTRGLTLLLLSLAVGSFILTGCQPYRNFTTYYNRFWNMERIMAEVEDEVDYNRSLLEPPQPEYYVPYDEPGKGAIYSEHLKERTLDPEEVKANRIKLDSIILKGSLLLSRQAESDYVDDAVFYMAKALFYRRDWYDAIIKTEELVENFPESKWQPDAHLIKAMALMEQGQADEAEQMLSRTVDVAFRFKRTDILVEAYRLNADIQLAQGEVDQAVKPYDRAIVLSDDDEDKARWQYEIGVLYFRTGQIERSIEAFDKVAEYDPSDLTEFETGLQRAVALRTLKRYDEAEAQLNELADDDDFESWHGMTEVERLTLEGDRNGVDIVSRDMLNQIDSAYGGGSWSEYGLYERGVRFFRAGNYPIAFENFSGIQWTRAPFYNRARRYTAWLGSYRDNLREAQTATAIRSIPFPDSLARKAANAYYNVARFFVNFEVADSIEPYYRLSAQWAPRGSVEGGRALYALASIERERGNVDRADSLYDLLVEGYGATEYATEARRVRGYTTDYLIDPAQEVYLSGRSFLLNASDYDRALEYFGQVVDQYPYSSYAPQSLYAMGLIYEKHRPNVDSALYYYSMLLERYPNSIQAEAVRPSVEKTLASRGPDEGTTTDDGLVPLGQGDNRPVDPVSPTPTADTPADGGWYDPTLYETSAEMTMIRRGQRTLDLP